MTSALVIGRDGKIGKALVQALTDKKIPVSATSRRMGAENYFDLLVPKGQLPCADVTYFCAACTRFIDCESGVDSWLVNVDAPAAVARRSKWFVHLSSDAVERALHTAYGLQKAFSEMAMSALPNVSVVRISKINESNIDWLCANLIEIGTVRRPGLTRLI